VNTFESPTHDTDQLELERKDAQPVAPLKPPEQIEAPRERIPTITVETAADASVGLTFSCVLIPRFDDHYLTGDIATDLPKWMREVCISYGWRMDAVTIRPGYLHWVMTVPLNANPAHFMRVARRQTSEKIFENYPRFSRKNVSNDFWAPGFSVAAGSQVHAVEDIDNFIVQTRRQQGIF